MAVRLKCDDVQVDVSHRSPPLKRSTYSLVCRSAVAREKARDDFSARAQRSGTLPVPLVVLSRARRGSSELYDQSDGPEAHCQLIKEPIDAELPAIEYRMSVGKIGQSGRASVRCF